MTSSTATQDGALVERRGNVLVVTINRPDARNAVNAAVSIGVGGALVEAENNPEIRAVVITGAGDKSFCAGADLKAISRGEGLHAPGNEHWGFAGFVNHFISMPVIAAVNGTALGGGTELALAADLIVATESASFGLPEVKRGLIAGAGGVFRLPAQIPQRLAMEMIFTGDPISAARALEFGLINEVVADGTVVEAAVALAERISVNAPLSVQASKRLAYGVFGGVRVDETEKWNLSATEWDGLMDSEDAKEGPLAFAEKRAPVWKAR
jgi:crotonobetainyl-CoA hydratase